MSYDEEVCIAEKSWVHYNKSYVQFTPLYIKKNQDSSSFTSLNNSEKVLFFPNRGKLICFLQNKKKDEYDDIIENKFFVIQSEDDFKVSKYDPDKDLKRAKYCKPLLPIIESLNFKNATFEYIRRNLDLIPTTEYKKAYLHVGNNKYILITQSESKYIIVTNTNDDFTVPIYIIDAKDKLHYTVKRNIAISICLHATIDESKFFSPKDNARFLESFFKKVTKVSHYLDDIEHLRTALKNDPSILEKAFQGYDIFSIIERFQTLKDVFVANDYLYEKVRETFSDFPQFQEKLEQEKISLRKELDDELQQYEDEEKNKIEQRIDEQVTEKKSVLAVQKAVLEEIEEKIRLREEDLQSQKERFQDEVQEYEAKRLALQKSLRQQADIFQDMLRQVSPAEMPYARAFADRLTNLFSQGDAPCLPSAISPWGSVRTKETEPISVSNIHGWLQYTIDDENVILLDECVRSGRIPLLFGEYRYAWTRLYANTVAGGTLCRMQADPTIFSLDDLWRIPSSTVPTPLAMAWEYNKRTGKPVVVQIDIEESPCHLWGEQLLDLVGNSDWPLGLWLVFTAGHFCSTTNVNNMPCFIPLECATPIDKNAIEKNLILDDVSRIQPKDIENFIELTSAFNKKFF